MYERRYTLRELGDDADRNSIKRAIERKMKVPGEVQPRSYVWGRIGDTVLVRTGTETPGFTAGQIPRRGAIIDFAFHAAPKRGHKGKRNGKPRSTTRCSLFLTVPIEDWAQAKLADAGLDVIDMETVYFQTKIGDRTALQAGMIMGQAKVANRNVLTTNLVQGIPSSGPRCWGFGTMILD
jgi:hypothetical protein